MPPKTLHRREPLIRPAYAFDNTFLHACHVESAAMELRDALAKPWMRRAGYVAITRPDDWAWHDGRVFECGHFFELQCWE
jgi:hypothetical protein